MVTRVHAEQTKLHDQYAALRSSILNHYALLPLVGREAAAKAYKIPPKLGHWGPQHSERVRATCPEAESAVCAIEALIAQRSPAAILAKHGHPRRGGRRTRGSGAAKVQLNPGEWPPRYK
jgi:hypothetical protein